MTKYAANSPQSGVRVSLVEGLKTVNCLLARKQRRQLARQVFASAVRTIPRANDRRRHQQW